MTIILCLFSDHIGVMCWNKIIPILAIFISIFSLLINRYLAKRSLELSIKQSTYESIVERVRICNSVWHSERSNNVLNIQKSVTEIIISIEIIEGTCKLYERQYPTNRKENESNYYYLFYKQLSTDLRLKMMTFPYISKDCDNIDYSNQLKTISDKFKFYFEQ